jgi:hypothetical protein
MAGDKTSLIVGTLGTLAVAAIGYLRPTNQAANAAAEAAQAQADSLANVTMVDTTAHAAHDSTDFHLATDSTAVKIDSLAFDPKKIIAERDSLRKVLEGIKNNPDSLKLNNTARDSLVR